MNNLIPELSFKEIEKGDSFSINLLREALSDHGFFSITDHGLSKKLVDNCYESAKTFFDLDFEVKNTYSSVGSKGARGYTPKGIETAVGEKIADQKEFWHHGPVVDDSFDKKIPKNLIILCELINTFMCFIKLDIFSSIGRIRISKIRGY